MSKGRREGRKEGGREGGIEDELVRLKHCWETRKSSMVIN